MQSFTRPANVFYFSVNCMLIFFGVWQGQRNAEQQGHLKRFLLYANNSEVLPALLTHSGECQSNNLRWAEMSPVWGVRARAPPGREWHVFFCFQGNGVRRLVIICMVVVMLTQLVGGCHFK